MKANAYRDVEHSVLSRVLSYAPKQKAERGPEATFLDELHKLGSSNGRGRQTVYEKTGNAVFDAVLEAAKPQIIYGYAPATRAKDHSNWIEMPKASAFPSTHALLSVFAHELIHWTGGAGPTKRPDSGMTGLDQILGFIPPGYGREEMVAELGGSMLLAAIGVPVDVDVTARYIHGWSTVIDGPQERTKAIQWATEQAEKAVDWLLMNAGIEVSAAERREKVA